MVPSAATWSNPLIAVGTPVMPIMVHGVGPHLPDGDGLLDPSSVPVVLLHGKLHTIPIDGMVGLCHMVREC